jgi:hypothetical protein
MKKNQNSNKSIRQKLTLRLEHIIQLSPLQLKGIQGASIYDSCDFAGCTKPT